jgi:hypothetical protein
MKKSLGKRTLPPGGLTRIRARKGCKGASKGVLGEKFDEHSDCNRDILSSTPLMLPIRQPSVQPFLRLTLSWHLTLMVH